MDYDQVSDLSSPLSSLPSSPLSTPPLSPLIPPNWENNLNRLTPPPSQDAGDDMPPARKRRKIEPKVRTTQHLDLTSDTAQSEYDRRQAQQTLISALRKRRKIVVIAGAGISVSAGIPDFRSSHGLFNSLRGQHKLKGSGRQLFDASVYKDDSSTSNFHDMVRQLAEMAGNAKPTIFHQCLARMATEDRLLRLYTQNVDGLETSLSPLTTSVPLAHKGPWPRTIQLHGGLEKMMCQKCRQISDFDSSLFQGPKPPACPQCVAEDDARTNVAGKRSHGIGRLRPRMVLYNEHNPDDEAIGAVTTADIRTRPDCVIVVGTSMKIPGVRRIVSQMCKIVRDRREGTTIWINRDGVPTGKDLEDCWDLVVRGDSDDVARLANLRDWDDPNISGVEDYTDSDIERVKAKQGEIRVEIPPTPQKPKAFSESVMKNVNTAVLTPPRSQHGDLENVMPQQEKPRIKLKITLPSRISGEIKKEKNKSLSNPASTGRKLSDLISNQGNTTKSKSKTSHKKAVPNDTVRSKKPLMKPTQPRLINLIKASKTKPTSGQTISKKAPLSPKKESEINSKRTNDEVDSIPTPQSFNEDASPAPEGTLAQTPPPITNEAQDHSPAISRSSSWSNQETVSPKGNIPKDMVRLLN